MNTMNMPGFTAESSLWKSNGHRYMGVSHAFIGVRGAASRVTPSSKFWCNLGCNVVCDAVAPEFAEACFFGCAWACD
jgi:hypothetical protein